MPSSEKTGPFVGKYAQEVDDLLEGLVEDVDHMRSTMAQQNIGDFKARLEKLLERGAHLYSLICMRAL